MDPQRIERLAAFASWVQAHIKGDEKGESQVFLDRFFQAFGHGGTMEAGATYEERIKKLDGKGTSFADLVWKPVVLIEMKKRGENLAKHFRQAFDYWMRLVPGRPRYVILCNFDEFWIYDFDTQIDSPLDRVKVADLPSRWGPLAFLFPKPETPRFGNDQLAVTRKAADHLAECFNKLTARDVDRALAQRFVLQMLVALFAEDIGLLDRYFVARLLDDCKTKQDSYDLLGGLFDAMNAPGKTPGGRYAGVDYFNGGLFREPARIELRIDEVEHLRAAAAEDWSKVRPEIFGALFEHSLGKEERHAFGAHFTSAVDIMKIVGPTIVDPWREQIEAARTPQMLRLLRQRMQDYHVLDPACGSGNFLYIAYRQLKWLDARISERLDEMAAASKDRDDARQIVMGFVSARQFHGIDVNPFAVELAKVTMMIARKFAIDEFRTAENALPLDNLDANFLVADALIDPLGNPTAWPRADVIIGNPPFLDARKMTKERGREYVKAIELAYPAIPRRADYCVYWFRKAHDSLSDCCVDDPLIGRAGLVGTQNIRNNDSRVGGLDYIASNGTIIEAVDNQPWSGEANVHVSLVNWIKTLDGNLIPTKRKLWSKVVPSAGETRGRGKGVGPASKVVDLVVRECLCINSSLSDQVDASKAKVLATARSPKRCFEGVQPGHDGFRLTFSQMKVLARQEDVGKIVFPYLNGEESLTRSQFSEFRYIIDFGVVDIITASSHVGLFKHVQTQVLQDWQDNAHAERGETGSSTGEHQNRLQKWWQLKRRRGSLIEAMANKSRYIVCARVTKRSIFQFVDTQIRPDSQLSCFVFEDDYSFGLLQSSIHWLWFITKCSKLTERFRYTPESVFDTFPWPQSPTVAQIDAVAAAGREVRRVRADALTKIKGGLRAVYRTLELPGKNPLKDAHADLDRAVMAAYGFSAKDDLLAQLLALNLEVARREADGLPVTAPGVPPIHPDPARLVTDDCIRAS